MEDAGKRSQQGGLAESGNAFEQRVTAGNQADEYAVYHLLLPDNDFGDFPADGLETCVG